MEVLKNKRHKKDKKDEKQNQTKWLNPQFQILQGP